MSAVETEVVALTKELEQVITWRFDELVRAGYPQPMAADIAASNADLHLAVRLLVEGCRPETAAEILL